MPERTMRTALSIAALTVLAWSTAPSERAGAQAFSSNATIYIDGQRLKNESNIYIDRTECAAEWRFELQGYATSVPYLEMWGTNNVNTNCADPANRNSANGNTPNCWPIGVTQNNVNPKATFVVTGAQIFNAVERNDTTTCDPDINGLKYKVQFVTLDSFTVPGATTAQAANANANQISAIFQLYSAIPKAPLDIKPIRGEVSIGLSYDKIDNNVLTRYRAYLDHDPNAPVYSPLMDGGIVAADSGAAITCGTGALDPLRLADGGIQQRVASDVGVNDVNIFRSGAGKGSSLKVSGLDAKNIPLNTYTSVAVAAVDGAGNEGYLSQPICVLRQETQSYLDTCENPDEDCGDLDSCSLSSTRHRNTGSALWLSACTLAISAWARRRRRST